MLDAAPVTRSRAPVSRKPLDADLIRWARLATRLPASDGCFDLGRELGWHVRLDPDAGLLVVDAFERATRTDLLHERARVIRQRFLDAFPACGGGLGETRAQRV